MIVFLSSIYFVLGLLYLLIPSIALELGRPKDLLKGGLFFLLAFFLLIKKNTFNDSDLIILLCNNFICFILIAEINLLRWNYLSEKEKNSFKNFSVLQTKLLLFLDALKLANKKLLSKSKKVNTFNKNADSKIWVRSEKDKLKNNINNSESSYLLEKDSEITNIAKEDIIVDENN